MGNGARLKRALVSGAMLAASVLFEVEQAQACGACSCLDQEARIVNLQSGAPLNLQVPLRVYGEGEAAPWLERAADGAKVPATVERRGAPAVWWLAVDEDLEPNTDYLVMRESGPESSFLTGSFRDEAPPILETIRVGSGSNAELCSSSSGGQMELGNVFDDSDTWNLWVEIEVVMGQTPYIVYSDYRRHIALGSSPMGCFGPLEIPGMVADTGYAVGITLHDAAGHVSELKTDVFTALASEPAGCGTPPSGTAGSNGSPLSGDPDEDRTSMGCGCALPAQPERWHPEAMLAALLLVGLAARRLSLT